VGRGSRSGFEGLNDAWSRAFDFLRENGIDDPFELTPKQAIAELKLADERYRRRLLAEYSITRAAQHADKKADEKLRKSLENGQKG
jgi:hypothetical protein